MPTREIASALGVSEAHLSKVLQRLARLGLVKSVRGPKGGFVLARPADEIALLEVHEAIDGPLSSDECLLGAPVCRRDECILGDLLTRVTTQVTEYLSSTSLAEVVAGRERE